jgi:amidohydrolase
MNTIKKFIDLHKSELYDLRRWFHQHPEISYKEYNTSQFVQDYLTKLGVSFNIQAGTGVEATIGSKGKVAACRLNMDALPIPEKSDFHHCSLVPGYSHACGHDFELGYVAFKGIFIPLHERPRERHKKRGN